MTTIKQNSSSEWKMFSTTLGGSKGVPPADSKSSVAIFGAIDNTMHFRIEAKNFIGVTNVSLVVPENGNVIADLLQFSKYANTNQVAIIIGCITYSSLTGPLRGQSLRNLINLIDENRVYVHIAADGGRVKR